PPLEHPRQAPGPVAGVLGHLLDPRHGDRAQCGIQRGEQAGDGDQEDGRDGHRQGVVHAQESPAGALSRWSYHSARSSFCSPNISRSSAGSAWSYPSRCRHPCTVSRASSCARGCPELAAWSAANAGHSTMSPSIAGPGSGRAERPPGESSSIGKLITSVGPGRVIHVTCRSAIVSLSTRVMDSSAAGCTSIRPITKAATSMSSASSASTPDSLATSILIGGGAPSSCDRTCVYGPVRGP